MKTEMIHKTVTVLTNPACFSVVRSKYDFPKGLPKIFKSRLKKKKKIKLKCARFFCVNVSKIHGFESSY